MVKQIGCEHKFIFDIIYVIIALEVIYPGFLPDHMRGIDYSYILKIISIILDFQHTQVRI